jgi:hypothetical protein
MKRTIVVLVSLALVACSNAATEYRVPDAAGQAEAVITSADIQQRIAFLASDELEGRDTPSRGLERAAAWIADEFERFGLEPAGEDGWMQRYPYPLEGLDETRARVEISGGAVHTLGYGTEFFADPGSAPGQAVGVVYAGDIANLDRSPEGGLKDRAVIVRLPGGSQQARGGVRFDADTRGRVAEAGALARDAGAATLLFVMDERITGQELAALARTALQPSRTAGGRATEGAPARFFLTHQAAVRMFGMAGLDGAEQLRRSGIDRPVPLPGITVRVEAPWLVHDHAEPPNVVGVVRGSDPALRDTYVVLSAHMDHVGIGAPDATGDSIYNGADDNASGTAAIMAIARAFASMPEPPARSILFIAVSGEEKGLVGSRWFADHPTVPIESMVANLNLDMIGRNAPDSIVVIGKEHSSLGHSVREVARRNPGLGLTVAPDPWPEQRFFFRSDHFSFAAKEIPALFFFAGVHEDYHRPSDTAEKIDFDKTARVARLAFLLARDIAQNPEPPTWDAGGLEEVRRLTRP